jgi:hypothetical protein
MLATNCPMPGRMDAAQASPVSAWMAVSREQNDHPLVPRTGWRKPSPPGGNAGRLQPRWPAALPLDPCPACRHGLTGAGRPATHPMPRHASADRRSCARPGSSDSLTPVVTQIERQEPGRLPSASSAFGDEAVVAGQLRTAGGGGRPPTCGGDRQGGGHVTSQRVGQRELPGQVRLLDGDGYEWAQACRVGR